MFPAERVLHARSDLDRLLDGIGGALHSEAARRHRDASLADRLNRIAVEERSIARLLLTALCTDGHRGPAVESLAKDGALSAAAQSLAGSPLSGSLVRVRASLAAFPDAAHPWHSDVALDDASECARVRIAAWIPLGDGGPGPGGLEVAGGRRRTPLFHEKGAGYSIPPADLDGLPRSAPACPAGSVLFLDRFTPHRTIPVEAGGRFALIIWFKAA